MNKACLLIICFLNALSSVYGQQYDMLLRGGHVIDPKNNIDGPMDVAIKDGKIAAVSKNIDEKMSKQVIVVKGLFVTPGIIDIHGHVFAGTTADGELSDGSSSLPPDGFTFRVGVTTIVDAGSSGAKTFATFKKNIIDHAQTRVLAFLNISKEGMRGDELSDYQQNVDYMDPQIAADTINKYRELLIGVKVAHFHKSDFIAVDRAVEAGNMANVPVMVDFGGAKPRLSLEELFLKKLRPGDIFTHVYGQLIETKETIVDVDTRQLRPFMQEARKRGILFDVGHGGGSFTFSQAIPATRAGFFPNTISTDLHTGSMNAGMKDMLNVMSKFLALNMSLREVIRAGTWSSAQTIKREELGNLSVGSVADVAVLNVRNGKFSFYDVAMFRMDGKQKLECEMTIREGKVVYDLNARSIVNNAQ